MTQQELKLFSFKIIDRLIAKQCYIKGYGKQYRVCDKYHNPEINLTTQQFQVLLHNRIVSRSDLIWTLSVVANPFKDHESVKLPSKIFSKEEML